MNKIDKIVLGIHKNKYKPVNIKNEGFLIEEGLRLPKINKGNIVKSAEEKKKLVVLKKEYLNKMRSLLPDFTAKEINNYHTRRGVFS